MGFEMTQSATFQRKAATGSDGGFSLVEVMLIIALIGIIMSIALPASRDFILQSRLTSTANSLVSDILYARSEAASRGTNVVLCPTADASTCSNSNAAWSINRFIFADLDGNGEMDATDTRLKFSTALANNMTLTPQGFTSLTRIRFNNAGGAVPLGSSGSFKLCATGAAVGRQISIGINGRPSASKVTCP